MRLHVRLATLAALAGCAAWIGGCRRRKSDTTGAAITARTLGLVYLQQNRLPEAEQQFRTVVDLAPDQPLGYADLGLVHLRLERYDDARKELEKALELDSTSVDARLTLVKVFELTGRPDRARQTLLAAHDSTDPRVLWALANVDTQSTDPGARAQRLRYLTQLAQVRPSNVAARFALVRTLAEAGRADSALQQLEQLQQIPPQAPPELRALYEPTMKALREGRLPDALALLAKFQGVAETTQAYQSGLAEVKGPPGPAAGYPVLTFNPSLMIASATERSPTAVRSSLRFVDATEDAGMRCASRSGAPAPHGIGAPTVVAAGDFDGDGGDDIFIGNETGGGSCLLRNEGALYGDVTQRAGIALPAGATIAAAAFGDYDNDGRLDLLVIETNGTAHLFHNTDGRTFRDEASAAHLGALPGVRRAVFVDLDHDGDLDLLLVGDSGTRVMRNNGDGTFTDATAEFGLTGGRGGRDAVFGDLDGDGRVDLVIAGDSGVLVYRNTSVHHFEPMPGNGGVDATAGATSIALGDYDNDGILDLALATVDGTPRLYRGRGDGTFEPDTRSAKSLASTRQSPPAALAFVDIDNDGREDLVVAGGSRGGRRGVSLLLNDGDGRFTDHSTMLPARGPAAASVAGIDYGVDGDMDLLVATDNSDVRLLRNDGGNANPYVRVQLTGLRTGSGKNNDFGIGARIDLRSGDLYQVRVATNRTTLFGLGAHLKADVVRIQWPNGVRQATYIPGSDRDALEQQVLKGSCAFLYTWNGRHYEMLGDLLWRSALGMPLGIMDADRTAWAPAAASREYVMIPGEMLQPRDGRYDMQLTEELWEMAYVDQLKLIAVDHPDSVQVLVNERFVPPANDPEPLRLHRLRGLHPVAGARDGDGTDVLPLLSREDDRYVATFASDRVQGVTRMHDLVLDLSNGPRSGSIALVLEGWIFPSDASINVDLSQSNALKVVAPSLDVRGADGRWHTAIADLGFPAGKRKVVIADLTGKFPTADRHVRIHTNMQIYWDEALVGSEAPAAQVRLTDLQPLTAELRFRGFSRTFRKGGRYGPQWFDYDQVRQDDPWLTIVGARTRFGDVLPLLGHSDDMYLVMGPGDATALQFDAEHAPTLPSGWRRDFLVYTDGWIKDSDLNTAHGTTVGPLPFHAMREYPYGADEHYPTDTTHQRYLDTYETRVVRRTPGDRIAERP